MNPIRKMIAERCHDGVPYTRLGDLLSFEQPTPYLVGSKNYDPMYETPVLTAGQTFLLGYTNEKHGIYDASVNQPVVIFDDFTTASKWVDFPFKLKSSAAKILRSSDPSRVSLRFYYFVLQSIGFSPENHSRHWISVFSEFRVPFPPLEIQQEIVRMLDSFTELEAELEAKLEARRSQYAFYRDQLLNFESVREGGANEPPGTPALRSGVVELG